VTLTADDRSAILEWRHHVVIDPAMFAAAGMDYPAPT
jgi:hypothetical protein